MIHRSEHNDNFTRVNNQLVNDTRLSLQAKGLMLIILSLPDDWSFSIGGLAHLTGLGRSTIERLLAELKKHGYAKPEIKRNSHGAIVSHDWTFYESAITSNCQIWCEPELADTTSGETQNMAQPEHGFLRCILTTNNNQLLNIPTTNIIKYKYGEFENVMLTPEEYSKLENKLGVELRDSLIFELSCYLKNHPKKYKDHYATILSWSRKRQKEKPKPTAIRTTDPFGDLLKKEGYQ